MKLNFSWQDDGKYHQYCININCHAETVERVHEDDMAFFYCRTCEQRNERRVVIDPTMKWWIADDGEYWHESAGVFLRNPDGKFLFFERTIFPVSALTVPAGHVDAGELPGQSAVRELHEEVGLEARRIRHVASENIMGDSCRRGSDAHRWHAYLIVLDSPIEVVLGGEGKDEDWLTLAAAKSKDLTYPVRYIIERYAADLEQTGDLD